MQRLLVPPDVIAGGRAEALLLGAFALLDDLERLRAGEAEGLAHLLYFFVSITRRLLALPRNARPPPPGGPGLPGAAWAPRGGMGGRTLGCRRCLDTHSDQCLRGFAGCRRSQVNIIRIVHDCAETGLFSMFSECGSGRGRTFSGNSVRPHPGSARRSPGSRHALSSPSSGPGGSPRRSWPGECWWAGLLSWPACLLAQRPLRVSYGHQ